MASPTIFDLAVDALATHTRACTSGCGMNVPRCSDGQALAATLSAAPLRPPDLGAPMIPDVR